MADRYQALSGTPVGRFVIRHLGLPDPVPLARFSSGGPLVAGRVLVGGRGRLLGQVLAAVAGAGGDVVRDAEPGERYAGLVFDATDLDSGDRLVELQRFLTPVGRALSTCGRVVVLGTPPEDTGTISARVAQRALEGVTRSLGKELGRGSTVQLVYVAPGAEDRIASTLDFLLSAKSAYVCGQVIRIGTAVELATPPAADATAPLTGLVAVVTGAARGIGAAIAGTLRRDGATVVGVDVPAAASDLGVLMEQLGGKRVSLDITAPDAPQRLARTVAEAHGGVDIVVHNAGITRDKKLVNMTDERWTSVIDVNLRAPEQITAELLDQELIRSNGRVVAVASIAAIAGNAGQTNYAASKAGVIGLVDALPPAVADAGITVNAVAPGFIETQMTAKVPILLREAGRRMNAMSQGGLPVDVAETVAWLAHPGSYGVTANVVRVCGQSLLGA